MKNNVKHKNSPVSNSSRLFKATNTNVIITWNNDNLE